jgi:predicted protein tyrosine phosphatase
MIHVCPLARLYETIDRTGARHIVSLLGDESHLLPPIGIAPENHLWLRLHDVTQPFDGQILAQGAHIDELLRFVQVWDRATPLVVHCYAGISRSTASAFTAACALNPQREETAIAQSLRRASPTATPNLRIVALADERLGRNGRMVSAIESIGRGMFTSEAEPFELALD